MNKRSDKRISFKLMLLAAVIGLLAVCFALSAGAEEHENGDIIEFGSYPQYIVKTSMLAAGLDGVEKEWHTFDFFGEEEKDSMLYSDFEYGDARYRAVRIVYLRNEAQRESGFESGKTYYFRYFPIQWKIIDKYEGLVWANNVIDAGRLNNKAFFKDGGTTAYADSTFASLFASWDDCSVRSWLNEDFLNTAFSAQEQAEIIDTVIHDWNTTDKVFLLSAAEYFKNAARYEDSRPPTSFYIGPKPAPSKATAYSIVLGCKMPFAEYADDAGITELYNVSLLRPEKGDKNISLSMTVGINSGQKYEEKHCSVSGPDVLRIYGIRPAIRLRSIRGTFCDVHDKELLDTREENFVPPSCEKSGSHDVVTFCSADGKVLSRETVEDPPAGHEYEVVDENAFLCSSTVPVTYRCKKCGKQYVDETAEKRHTFGEYVSNGDATCRRDGTKSAKCVFCGAVDTQPDEGSRLPHRNKHFYFKAGYHKDGSEYDMCVVCRQWSNSRYIPSIDKIMYSEKLPEGASGTPVKRDLSNYDLSAVYTGKEVTFDFYVNTRGGNALKEGKDYKISYTGNVECGRGRVRIDFTGDYEGFIEKDILIVPRRLENEKITVDGTTVTATWDHIPGIERYMAWLVDEEGEYYEEWEVYSGSVRFENVRPGHTYWFSLRYYLKNVDYDYGEGIEQILNVPQIEYVTAEYTGEEVRPEISMENSEGRSLVENRDYTLTYSDNRKVGLARATILLNGAAVDEKEQNRYETVFRIVPRQITGLKISSVDNTSFTLDWSKAAGAKKYAVYLSGDGKKWERVSFSKENRASVSGLVPGGKYQFKVRAYAVSGWGRYSAVLKAQTKTAAPTGLSVSAVSRTGITLRWKAVFGAAKYAVYSSSDGKKWSKSKEVRTNSATVTRLRSGTSIQFRVVSVGLAGRSDNSSVLKTCTLTDAPAITGLTAAKSARVTVTWKAVRGARSYVVYRSYDGKKWDDGSRTTGIKLTFSKLKGQKLYVRIAAFNAYGRKSALSRQKSVGIVS